jgi:hypothetical protein
MVSPLTSSRRIIKKLDARGKTLFDPLFLTVTDQQVDVIGVAEVLLLDLPLTLEEPCVGMLDASHVFQQVTTNGGTDVLDQGLVIKAGFSMEAKFSQLPQQIDQLLGVDVQEVEMFIDGKP